jgi:hypothetical protein
VRSSGGKVSEGRGARAKVSDRAARCRISSAGSMGKCVGWQLREAFYVCFPSADQFQLRDASQCWGVTLQRGTAYPAPSVPPAEGVVSAEAMAKYLGTWRNGLVVPAHVQGSSKRCSLEVGGQQLRVDLATTDSGRNSCAAQQTCSLDHRGAIEFCKPRIIMLLHRGPTIVQ